MSYSNSDQIQIKGCIFNIMQKQSKKSKSTLTYSEGGDNSIQLSSVSPEEMESSQITFSKEYPNPQANNPTNDQKYYTTMCIKVKPVQIIDVTPSKRFLYDDSEASESSDPYSPPNYPSNHPQRLQNTREINLKQENQQQQRVQSEYQEDNEEAEEVEQQKKYNQTPIKAFFKAKNLSVLIQSEIPNSYRIKCLIKVQKQYFKPDTYDLYLEEDRIHLVRAQKSRVPLSGHFRIKNTKNGQTIANMYKNFTGTEYVLVGKDSKQIDDLQLAWISYSPNIFGFNGQRNIYLIKRKERIPKSDRFSDVRECWENGDRNKLEVFTNRQATIKNGSYSLDFKGVIKQPSNKNTIIQSENGKEGIIFGKKTNNIFILHVCHPISLIEGFAMAISNLDSKLLVH